MALGKANPSTSAFSTMAEKGNSPPPTLSTEMIQIDAPGNESSIHRTVSTTSSFIPAGVRSIEILAEHITLVNKICLFIGIFWCAFAYGLDNSLRYVYQNQAASALKEHAQVGTVGVVRAVVSAAIQPAAARIADVFGRFELILIGVGFYVLGTIIEATSSTLTTFSVGAVLYQMGYTSIGLLIEIVIADITTLRSRLLFAYLPALPFLANVWISATILDRVEKDDDGNFWRWGVGMWAIIFPYCAFPLLVLLWWINRKVHLSGALQDIETPLKQHGGLLELMKTLFWQLDVVGLVLMTVVLGCLLIPFTISQNSYQGNTSAEWVQPKVLVTLFCGVLAIPMFVLWERKTLHPIVPLPLLKDRAVWGALGIAVMFNFAYNTQFDYLYTVLLVGFDQSSEAATRINGLYGFVSVAVGALLGAVVYKVRYLKPFVLVGTLLWLIAFGLMIHFRGGTDRFAFGGVITAQVLLGIGGGMFPYPALASIQAATKHENLAVITSLYLSMYHIGSALGNCLSGAIWTQILPGSLERRLGNNIGMEWYKDPLGNERLFPVGTKERDQVIEVLKEAQRLICIAGISVCALLIFFAGAIRNPKLPDKQSIPQPGDDDYEENPKLRH